MDPAETLRPMRRSPSFLCTLLLLLATAATVVLAEDRCTSIAVGPAATTHGGTLNTHADDCYDCDFRILRVPAFDHAPNATRAIPPMKYAYPRYVGSDRGPAFEASALDSTVYKWENSPIVGTIPQVPHTYAYIDGSYGIANEHGVTIGESTCGGKLIAAPIYDGGRALLEVSELGRIGLERARTARELIAVMGDLAERYGVFSATWGPEDFMEAAESYTIADGKEVWLFHISPDDTGASAVWVAQRIPDDHVTVVTNTFRIREIPAREARDPDQWAVSANIEAVALRAGLWSGNVHGTGPTDGPLDWKKHYGYTPTVFKEPYVSRRTWRVFSLLAPSLNLTGDMTSWELPLSVRPDFLISAATLKAVHRDHFEGTKYDTTKGLAAGPFGNPNRYDAYEPTPRAKELRAPQLINEPRAMFENELRYLQPGARSKGAASAVGVPPKGGEYSQADLAAAAAAGDVDNVDRSGGEPLSDDDAVSGHFERTLSLFRTAYTVISETMPPSTAASAKDKTASSKGGAVSGGASKSGANTQSSSSTNALSDDSTPDYFGVRTWVAPHQPRTSIFVPVYPASPEPVPAPLATGSLFRADPSSLWWAACAVSNYAERAWRYITRDTDATRAAIEAVTDAEALALTKAGRTALAAGAKATAKHEVKAGKGAAGTGKGDKKAAKAAEKKAKSDKRARVKLDGMMRALEEYVAHAGGAGVATVERVAKEADATMAVGRKAAAAAAADASTPSSATIDSAARALKTAPPKTVAHGDYFNTGAHETDGDDDDDDDEDDDGEAIDAAAAAEVATWSPPAAPLPPSLKLALSLALSASASGGLPVAYNATAALARAHAAAAAARAHSGYWALFWRVLGRYHDGYRLDSSTGPEFAATALFYPTWWLKAVRYWRQDEGDVAAKVKETDAEHWGGDHCTPPVASTAAASFFSLGSSAPSSSSSSSSSSLSSSGGIMSHWGSILLVFLCGCLLFIAGAFAGARWAASPAHGGYRSGAHGHSAGEYTPIAQEADSVPSYGSR